jgi:hypothetical protein
LAGYGDITGDCGGLDLDAGPVLLRSVLDLGPDPWDPDRLSEGAQEVIEDDNLGGSSIESEALSYDMLYRCELAALVKTESEILYVDDGGKKTDLLVQLDGTGVGVSVTRAFHWPPESDWPQEEADAQLIDKLSDIGLSAANAHPDDAWERSFLSIIAYDEIHEAQIAAAWEAVDGAILADTVVWIIRTDGNDEVVY